MNILESSEFAHILGVFKAYRFSLEKELQTHNEIEEVLRPVVEDYKFTLIREKVLDKKNKVDFYIPELGLAIEVKIKGRPFDIYYQCERYCEFNEVENILLVTNKCVGWPTTINGKNAFLVSLGESWL